MVHNSKTMNKIMHVWAYSAQLRKMALSYAHVGL